MYPIRMPLDHNASLLILSGNVEAWQVLCYLL